MGKRGAIREWSVYPNYQQKRKKNRTRGTREESGRAKPPSDQGGIEPTARGQAGTRTVREPESG